jgi:two-component system cell cycle sensor histidine kinase/response regulator CckA
MSDSGLPVADKEGVDEAARGTGGRAMEAKLHENPEWFFTALRSIADAVVASDEMGRITFLNPAAETLTGWPQSEACGKPVGEVLRIERSSGPAEEAAAEAANLFLEAEAISRSGERRTVEAKSALIRGDGGRLMGVVRIVRDVGERKRLERRVLQTQKMEAVTRLAGGIAHDFNNLLTSINGYTEFLNQALGAESPLLRNVEGILASVDRAAKLTRQLLAFSRKQMSSPRATDLNNVIGTLLPSLNVMMDGNITLSLDLKKHLAPVLADPGEMEQMLLILVANARDAMPLGGRLAIATGETDYALEGAPAASGLVVLTVSDDGCGMNEEVKARLFEPFFTTKPVGKGTGLGLSTVYGIVKLAGGDIQVDSELGRGTAFRIYFPRHAASPAAQSRPGNTGDTVPGGETILLVEDDEEVRSLLYTILRSDGYAVIQARDGEEAMRLAETHAGPIHLVLSDLQMPKMGGMLLAENLLPRHPGMKAVLMSGFSKEDFPVTKEKDLPVSFLEKPFMPKSLIRSIRKVLDG